MFLHSPLTFRMRLTKSSILGAVRKKEKNVLVNFSNLIYPLTTAACYIYGASLYILVMDRKHREGLEIIDTSGIIIVVEAL